MNKLDISEWKEFSIGELFEVERPASRTVKQYETGNVPFVSSGNFNNGINKFVQPLDNDVLEKGNCLTQLVLLMVVAFINLLIFSVVAVVEVQLFCYIMKNLIKIMDYFFHL